MASAPPSMDKVFLESGFGQSKASAMSKRATIPVKQQLSCQLLQESVTTHSKP